MASAHDIAEHARLITHRLFAPLITPAHIAEARVRLERGSQRGATTEGEEMWLELLTQQRDEIVERMLEDTPEGRLLCSNSPFGVTFGITDVDERRRIWRQAESELAAAPTLREL